MFILIDSIIIIFMTLIFLTVNFYCTPEISRFIMDHYLFVIPLILIYSFFKYKKLKLEKGIQYFLIKYILGCVRYYIIFIVIAFYCFSFTKEIRLDLNIIVFMIMGLIPYMIIGVVIFLEDIIYEGDDHIFLNIFITLMMVFLFLNYFAFMNPDSLYLCFEKTCVQSMIDFFIKFYYSSYYI